MVDVLFVGPVRHHLPAQDLAATFLGGADGDQLPLQIRLHPFDAGVVPVQDMHQATVAGDLLLGHLFAQLHAQGLSRPLFGLVDRRVWNQCLQRSAAQNLGDQLDVVAQRRPIQADIAPDFYPFRLVLAHRCEQDSGIVRFLAGATGIIGDVQIIGFLRDIILAQHHLLFAPLLTVNQ